MCRTFLIERRVANINQSRIPNSNFARSYGKLKTRIVCKVVVALLQRASLFWVKPRSYSYNLSRYLAS